MPATIVELRSLVPVGAAGLKGRHVLTRHCDDVITRHLSNSDPRRDDVITRHLSNSDPRRDDVITRHLSNSDPRRALLADTSPLLSPDHKGLCACSHQSCRIAPLWARRWCWWWWLKNAWQTRKHVLWRIGSTFLASQQRRYVSAKVTRAMQKRRLYSSVKTDRRVVL